jgi:hypothetical protein
MNKLITILIFVLFISCSNKNNNNTEISKTSDSILTVKDETISQIDKHKISSEVLDFSPDLAGFQNLISNLDRNSIKSIKVSQDFITTRLPDTIKIYDSLYYSYMRFFYATVNNFNDSLYERYTDLIPKLEQDLVDNDTREFNEMLNNSGLILLMSEGYFYVDSKSDYFSNLFDSRLSLSSTEYMNIRKKELKEGFSEDAGMLISFDQLADRVIIWENYINKYPNAFNIDEAKYYYQSYLETLLTGMDNSRVYDLEDEYVLPEIREIYKQYIEKNPDRKSTQIIEDYYNFIERHEFRYNDSIDLFLKKHNLSSMLGVQPHLR